MIEPLVIGVATATVSALRPYFEAAAKKFAEKGAEGAYAGAGKLITWLRRNQSLDPEVPLKKALDRVETDPTNDDKSAALRITLEEFLTQNPSLMAELKDLLPAVHATGDQLSRIDGDNNDNMQAIGQDITFNVNRP